jgi:transcriptional regulator with XRE-family HTH domain
MIAKNLIIGERIRECRKKNNWSQEQLAERLQENFRLNTDRFTVSKWETGFQEPTMYPIKCMSELFGVAMDYLTGHSDNPVVVSESHSQYTSSDSITLQSLKDEHRILLSSYDMLGGDEKEFFRKQIERAARERGETDDNG